MAGLVPAIHVFLTCADHKDVDARDKPGHDELKFATIQQKGPGKTGAFSSSAEHDQRE
jgi:hypothetical protein